MFILYTLPASQDSFEVKDLLYSYNVEYQERSAMSAAIQLELRELTGSTDTPYLYDKGEDIALSGKKAIVAFLEEKYRENSYKNLI